MLHFDPITVQNIIIIIQNPLLIASYNMIEKWISLVTEKKWWANFMYDTHFLIFIKIMWFRFLELFWFYDHIQMATGNFLAKSKLGCQFSSGSKWIFLIDGCRLSSRRDGHTYTMLTIFKAQVFTVKSVKPFSSWPFTGYFFKHFVDIISSLSCFMSFYEIKYQNWLNITLWQLHFRLL